MRKLLWLFALLLFLPLESHAQGTQIVTLIADPALCNTGSLYYNSVTDTLKSCGPANVWSAAGGNGTSKAIDVTTFGAKFNGQICSGNNVTITGSSQTVSCLTSINAPTGGASVTGNVATINLLNSPLSIGSIPWAAGQSVIVSGFGGGDVFYNGTVNLTVVTSTSISYVLVHANASSTTAGTVQNTVVGPFSAANDPGKTVWGSTVCCNIGPTGSSTLAIPASTTISSVTNSFTIQISQNAALSANGTHAYLYWATDDTTALQAAETAYANSPTCTFIIMPAGFSLTTQPLFNHPPIACQSQDAPGATSGTTIAGAITGQGNNQTVIYMAPSFNFAGCIFGISGTSCFLGFNAVTAMNWGIAGGWNNNILGGHSNILVHPGNGSRLINMSFNGFGAGDGTTIGVQMEAFSHFQAVYVEAFGDVACVVNASGQGANWFGGACGNSNGSNFELNGSGVFNSYGMWFGQALTTQIHNFGTGTWNSTNDYIFGAAAIQNFADSGAMTYNFNNLQMDAGAVTGLTILQSGTRVNARNSQFQGSSNAVNRTAGTFFDLGGNAFTTGAITTLAPNTCTESNGNGTCALIAGSTNEKGTVRITAGTTTLLNPSFSMNWAGTFSGASGAAPACTFIIKNTGTGSWITAAPLAFGLPFATAISTSAVTVNIATTVNTVSASTYDVGYNCTAQ
jgi:hypothetical protein